MVEKHLKDARTSLTSFLCTENKGKSRKSKMGNARGGFVMHEGFWSKFGCTRGFLHEGFCRRRRRFFCTFSNPFCRRRRRFCVFNIFSHVLIIFYVFNFFLDFFMIFVFFFNPFFNFFFGRRRRPEFLTFSPKPSKKHSSLNNCK